ncbi:MAG: hypothetical protein ACK5MJ_04520 [Alphaproteobacteria bacterium]
MKVRIINIVAMVAVLGVAACSGMGSSYEPVIDGKKDAKYYSNLAACQNLSKQKQYVSNSNAGKTALGAGIGALVTSGGNRSDIAEGAAIGAGIGAATAGITTMNRRQSIIEHCMRGRGYRIVG